MHSVKLFAAVAMLLLTYVAVSCNLPYLEQGGHHGVVMALAVYGQYDLFLAGVVMGSFGMLLIAMVFENINLFVYMGIFSLVIMAVHYILFPYVKPVCSRILDISMGGMIYPAAVVVCCFVSCVPLCYIIDWAIPELNGKSI